MKIFIKTRATRAFTLIELLVVIAIIGLLSTVVLASLNSARLRATDTAIKAEVIQLAKILALEYSNKGSYVDLQPGSRNISFWFGHINDHGNAHECNDTDGFLDGSKYREDAIRLCQSIINKMPENEYYHYRGAPLLFLGVNTDPYGGTDIDLANQKFSIVAYMPGKSKKAGENRSLCVGSSGSISDDVPKDSNPSKIFGWRLDNSRADPGCPGNP